MEKSGKQWQTDKIKLFFSYSRQDMEQVEMLHKALSSDDELEVFLDTHDIVAAEEWKLRLEDLIRSADSILVVLSPASASSEVCQWEMELAESLNKRIIPVVVKDVDEKDIPEAISKLNYIFCREDTKLESTLKAIGQALKIDIGWIREHTRLADLAYRWDQARELGAQPLRGKELEGAEQWLSNQPKDAPAPTEIQRRYIYESRKSAIKRQRVALAGSISALLVVSVLVVFAWVQSNAAIESERKAYEALKAATEAANTMVIDLGQNLQNELIPSSVTKKILDRAVELQNKLIVNFKQNALLEYSRSVSLVVLSELYKSQNDIKNTEKSLKQALSIVDRFLKLDGKNHFKWMQNKSYILEKIGNVFLSKGKTERAIASYLDALHIMDLLVDIPAAAVAYRTSRIGSLQSVSDIYYLTGQTEKALEYILKAEKYQRILLNGQYTVGDMEVLVSILDRKGDFQRQLNNNKQAMRSYDESRKIQKVLIRQIPNNDALKLGLTGTISSMAAIHGDNKDFATAKKMYLDILNIRLKLNMKNTGDTSQIEGIFHVYDQLRIISMHESDVHKAIEYSANSIEIIEPLVKVDSKNSQWLFLYKGAISKQAATFDYFSQYEGALESFEKALDLTIKLHHNDLKNIQWIKDASIINGKIGNLKREHNKHFSALSNYKNALKFNKLAIDLIPKDSNWQINYLISLIDISKVEAQIGKVHQSCKHVSEFFRHSTKLKIAGINSTKVRNMEMSMSNMKQDCKNIKNSKK